MLYLKQPNDLLQCFDLVQSDNFTRLEIRYDLSFLQGVDFCVLQYVFQRLISQAKILMLDITNYKDEKENQYVYIFRRV